MISVVNQNDNIWETNPHLELISFFKDLKKRLGDVKSSKLLTAVYLIHDPKSPLRNSGLSEEEIKKDITDNYISQKGFTWADHKDLIEFYKSTCLSKTEKLFLQYESDLEELGKILSKNIYTVSNATDRAKLTKEYKILTEGYIELRSKVDIEKAKSNDGRGKYKKSLTEAYSS